MKRTAMSQSLSNMKLIRGLTFMMFLVFAMTTDSVGAIIPQVIKQFGLSLTAGGSFHYASMAGISLAGLLLGSLADRLGRKRAIIAGLALFAVSSYLFALSNSFALFVSLLFVSGLAIGIFKTGALALIGDVTRSTTEHTSLMNMAEGFFGVGAIIGPFIVSRLLLSDISWKWLYVIAATGCVALILIASLVRYPAQRVAERPSASIAPRLGLLTNRYALGFSTGISLYVAVEAGIYVWMPTFLLPYEGPAKPVAAYALSIFFILRAGGRFLGAWMLARFNWKTVLALFSLAIFGCFAGSIVLGLAGAVYLLPLSGLFMSVMYPTINSKGISCFPKSEHGAVAGIILFFTCVAAILAPLAMAAISDVYGDPKYGFILSTALAFVLFVGVLLNAIYDPCRALMQRLDLTEYSGSV
jgi:fucose permease